MGKEELGIKGKVLAINAIERILPHRYPFLLVDRILEWSPTRIVGVKNVTINEPFFQGHFPDHPIMPGVLIVEAMAQVGGVLAFKSADVAEKLVYFIGIDKAKFRKPVFPGDTLRFEISVVQHRSSIWRLQGNAFVGGKLVSEAELTATIVDRKS